MNDEIKEILECLKIALNSESYEVLLDYITNLQQQLHQASLDIQELTERDIECPSWCDKLTNLQQEIEKLNDDKRSMLVQLYKANDNRDKVKQENEELKRKLDRRYYKNEYERIKKENERLKQELKDRPFMDYTTDVYEELEDYKSRCEKASDLLTSLCMLDNVTITNNACEKIDAAIKMLQNGSDNNE